MSERDEDRGSSPRVGAFFASMSVDGAVSYLLKESCPTQCVTHPRHLLHNPHLLSELLLREKGVKVCLVF